MIAVGTESTQEIAGAMAVDAQVVGVGGLALGVVLMLAGMLKMARGTFELKRMIGHLLPISAGGASMIAAAVVVAELALGAWIVTGAARPYALLGALGLVSVFTLALGLAAARRHEGGCECFGGPSGSAALGIVRNLVLAGVLGAQLVFEIRAGGAPGLGSMSVAGVLMGVLWGGYAIVLFRTLAWLETAARGGPVGRRYGPGRRDLAS